MSRIPGARVSGIPKRARILIMKTHAIGDLLLTTPAIRDIRRAWPDAEITLLTATWSAPVVRNNPHLDRLIEVDDRVFLQRRWGGLMKLCLRLLARRFDAAFLFHPLPAVHALAWLARIPRRYGLVWQGDGFRLTAGHRQDFGVYDALNFQNVAALAGAKPGSPRLEAYPSSAETAKVAALLEARGVAATDTVLLVAPGGGRNSKDDVAAKRWPSAHFTTVLAEFARRRPEVRIVISGAKGDRPETRHLAERLPSAVDLSESVTLGELIALTRRARTVLCNDSAVLHLAVAAGVPVVAPFGPTSRTRFLPEGAREFSPQATIACSPCYISGAFPGCDIGYRCMQEITPETVLANVEAALDAGPRAPAFDA